MIASRLSADGAAERVLSARQLEVLVLIARGLSTEGIAGELVVSPCTVRAHVRNILGVLGARNRAHAVAIACLTGLLGIDEYAAPGRATARGRVCEIGAASAAKQRCHRPDDGEQPPRPSG
jgi:DNA-binding CsgD family transcriptional regulator